jgi:hypothetical protein
MSMLAKQKKKLRHQTNNDHHHWVERLHMKIETKQNESPTQVKLYTNKIFFKPKSLEK